MNVLDSLLHNLQTIGSIPKNHRISTTSEFIVIEDESFWQSIRRWNNHDSRDKSVQIVRKEVLTTVTIAKYMLESIHLYTRDNIIIYEQRVQDLKKIRDALIACNIGIDNLCITYAADAGVIGHFKPLIKEICACVAAIERKFAELNAAAPGQQ